MGDDARGKHVRAAIERLALDRLGSHVSHLALDPIGMGLQVLRGGLGNAEVDDFQGSRFAYEQVGRRHVAVHEPEGLTVLVGLVVRVVEGVTQLAQERHDDGQRRGPRDAARLLEHLPHIASVDELHRDEIHVAHASELVQLNHVGVLEHGGQLGLAHERPNEGFILGQVWQQALQCYQALEPLDALFLGAMNRRHAADPEALVHDVGPEDLGIALGTADPVCHDAAPVLRGEDQHRRGELRIGPAMEREKSAANYLKNRNDWVVRRFGM